MLVPFTQGLAAPFAGTGMPDRSGCRCHASTVAARDSAPTSWQGMAREKHGMIKHWNRRMSDSIHPQTWNEFQTSIFNTFFLWHYVCPQHMSRQRIHFGFPTLKFPQVLGFELGQKTHKKIMGFYGIIMGKLWVFTGSGKTGFSGNYGFLWEDYVFFMGKLWVFIQTLLFSIKIR